MGAGAGAAIALRATPRYTADAQLIVTVTSGATTGELAQGSNLLVSLALLVLRELLGAKVRTAEQTGTLAPAHMLGSVQLPRSLESDPIAVVHEPHSETAEGFRQLRTNLRFIQNDTEHKVILVTSSILAEEPPCEPDRCVDVRCLG